MKHQKPFTARKMKHEFAEALVHMIDTLFEDFAPNNDDDRLMLAALAEVRLKMMQRMLVPKTVYQFQLSPAQAFGVRLAYTYFPPHPATQFGNGLRQLADEIHRHYC